MKYGDSPHNIAVELLRESGIEGQRFIDMLKWFASPNGSDTGDPDGGSDVAAGSCFQLADLEVLCIWCRKLLENADIPEFLDCGTDIAEAPESADSAAAADMQSQDYDGDIGDPDGVQVQVDDSLDDHEDDEDMLNHIMEDTVQDTEHATATGLAGLPSFPSSGPTPNPITAAAAAPIPNTTVPAAAAPASGHSTAPIQVQPIGPIASSALPSSLSAPSQSSQAVSGAALLRTLKTQSRVDL